LTRSLSLGAKKAIERFQIQGKERGGWGGEMLILSDFLFRIFLTQVWKFIEEGVIIRILQKSSYAMTNDRGSH
jgi:hypothetical protein